MRIEKAKEEQMEEILNIYREARQFMREQGNPDQWGKVPRRENWETGYEKREAFMSVWKRKINGAVFMFFTGTEPTYEVIWEGSWSDDRLVIGTLHRIAFFPENFGERDVSASPGVRNSAADRALI